MNVKLLAPVDEELNVGSLPVFNQTKYLLASFDERTLSFFDAFSKSILADTEINRLPEIAALAFWLRKSNLIGVRDENKHLFNSKNYALSPVGIVFHICPANVDTMFMYSLAVSLLMGNKNVLRVSNRMNAPQIKKLFGHFNRLISEGVFSLFANYINIITYEHSAEISTYISQRCNARVIWGGDNTIKTFRNIESAPRSRDIVFADRVSALCINARAYLGLNEVDVPAFAKKFFNDAYTFDQKGCSSPQNLYLIGSKDDCNFALHRLSTHLQNYVKEHYDTDIASIASLKLNRIVDDALENIVDGRIGNNYVSFVHAKNLQSTALQHSCGAGYFYVNYANSINELQSIVSAKLQTISYFGLDELQVQALIELSKGEGIDRIVPLGNALDFYYIWDGYNLLDELSRKVFIK